MLATDRTGRISTVYGGPEGEIVRRHQGEAPVKLARLARALGLHVVTQDLGTKISGKLSRERSPDAPSGFVIYVNRRDAQRRQRFTVAHELAHYILHRDLIEQGVVDDVMYRSGLPSRYEAQANEGAADILMPWHLINEYTAKGLTTVQELANQFEVTEVAMAIRLGMPA